MYATERHMLLAVPSVAHIAQCMKYKASDFHLQFSHAHIKEGGRREKGGDEKEDENDDKQTPTVRLLNNSQVKQKSNCAMLSVQRKWTTNTLSLLDWFDFFVCWLFALT